MAENKKSFVLYADLIHTVTKMPSDKAGELFKHILSYVNDKDPETDDLIIQLTFEPIKQQLKRDLASWENKIENRSVSGREGNLKRWHPDLYKEYKKGIYTLFGAENIANGRKVSQPDENVSHPIAKVAVNDTVTVNDNVNEIIDKSITYSKDQFLKDWNELRTEHLKKPSFCNRLTFEDKNNLESIAKDYEQEKIRHALIGLFKQKKMPNDSISMQSNPSHFLKFFNTYLTGYYDKNDSLYGKENK